MVKGKTKSGIKFEIDERIKDDARALYYLTALQKPDIEPMVASKQIFNLFELMFGSDDGIINFMNAVAESNNGVCDTKTMLTELTDMMESIDAKKS